jgi:NAD(P)-dependent dehydrogenase (short-subunit alcohol dehydrogenase family)
MAHTITRIPKIKIYPDKFKGQVAVITGAAQGLGEVTARLFAKQGALVVLFDIQEDKLGAVIEGITGEGGEAAYRVVDVTKVDQINNMIDDVINTYGQIHILIHLAGIYPTIPISKTTDADYRAILGTNMDACFFLVRAILPHMNERGYGRIICTASGLLQNVIPDHSVYIASKAAVTYFMRATTKECKLGVTANTICPGLIASPAVSAKYSESNLFQETVQKQGVKRSGIPEDVAHTICFIASPESSFTTGQLFDVGGGATFH